MVFYVVLDLMKFAICYILSGKAWLNLFESKPAFTTNKEEQREAQWTTAQRTLHGFKYLRRLTFSMRRTAIKNTLKLQSRPRGELRLQGLGSCTHSSHVDSVVNVKGLDIDGSTLKLSNNTIQCEVAKYISQGRNKSKMSQTSKYEIENKK